MIFCNSETPPAHKGFTLMEVLVVLVLVSLISGLLMQGFGHVLRLRFSVTQQLKKQRVQQLQESWFRSLITGILVNTEEEQALFRGDETMLQAQSINTLASLTGVPQLFTLKLDAHQGNVTLLYRSGDKEEWFLGQWSAEKASFSYLDNRGEWLSAWPPKLGVATQQLPQAIQLQIDNTPTPVNWIVSIPGRKNPKITVPEIL